MHCTEIIPLTTAFMEFLGAPINATNVSKGLARTCIYSCVFERYRVSDQGWKTAGNSFHHPVSKSYVAPASTDWLLEVIVAVPNCPILLPTEQKSTQQKRQARLYIQHLDLDQ